MSNYLHSKNCLYALLEINDTSTQMNTTNIEKKTHKKITKIYVGNLVYTMDEGSIYKLFTKFGKVGKIEIIKDPKYNRSKGIAFLQMFNKNDAQEAINKLNGTEVNGRTLKVSVALERDELPIKHNRKDIKRDRTRPYKVKK